jgi:hypothetical protein
MAAYFFFKKKKKKIVTKFKEVKIGCNVAESSREGCCTKKNKKKPCFTDDDDDDDDDVDISTYCLFFSKRCLAVMVVCDHRAEDVLPPILYRLCHSSGG